MTSLNAIRQKDRVHLICSGASLHPQNMTLCNVYSPVTIVPHLNCAFASSGAELTRSLLRDIVMNAGLFKFDEFIAFVNDSLLLEMFKRQISGFDKSEGARLMLFDFICAGFSKHGPKVIFTSGIDRPQFPAGSVADPGTAFFQPGHARLYQRFKPEGFDPVRDGIDLLETQRRSCVFGPGLTIAGQPTGCGVGGLVQLATVTADEITTKIIHRWDDEVGKTMGCPDWASHAKFAA
jgi:hypothetical protein